MFASFSLIYYLVPSNHCNGAPISDPQWRFHPLGDEDGMIFVSVGTLMGQNLSPPGEAGDRMFLASPFLFLFPVGVPTVFVQTANK